MVRVDGQVGDLPELVVVVEGGHALLDRVLVRSRERGVDEVAAIRVARVHRHAVAVLGDASQLVDVGDVEAGVDALREQVHRQRDQVDVACPLAVAEQAPFDPLGTGHDAELGRGDRRATIVVGMDAAG